MASLSPAARLLFKRFSKIFVVQVAIQAIFQELPHRVVTSINARNAFNAIFREAMFAALEADPRLHLLRIYRHLYMRDLELMYYQLGPNHQPRCIISARGVRHGWPLPP